MIDTSSLLRGQSTKMNGLFTEQTVEEDKQENKGESLNLASIAYIQTISHL